MTPAIDLGFIALTDAAPLIVAKAHGLFAGEGLDVSLHREVSWATIRDKVATGLYQGAHMLAPLAIATNLGVGSERAALEVPMALNAHGASLGVSAALAAEMGGVLTPEALAKVVAARRDRSAPAISFAVVFPYSAHSYMLRYWAAQGGVDPDADIRLTVAPPTAIAARLKSGEIDGFCVGAPWGDLCQSESGACIALEAGDFWPGGPDKVLGLSQSWAHREPSQVLALVRALIRAALWADAPENAAELAGLLAHRDHLDVSPDLIASGLGRIRFARHATLHPWRSHAAWIASQMIRWGQLDPSTSLQVANACYRPDLFRAAAGDIGFNAPLADSKPEGAHDQRWELAGVKGPISMAADMLPDGRPFDVDNLRAYAAGFAITRVHA